MTESIPIWEDWRFWQIVVTGALAFLGFTVGTWIKYLFDRRLDDRRRREESIAMAGALASEMRVIVVAASNRAKHLRNLEIGTISGALSWFNSPRAVVFEANAARLGLIPKAACDAIMKTRTISERLASALEMYAQAPRDTAVTQDSCIKIATYYDELSAAAATAARVLDKYAPTEPTEPDAATVP